MFFERLRNFLPAWLGTVCGLFFLVLFLGLPEYGLLRGLDVLERLLVSGLIVFLPYAAYRSGRASGRSEAISDIYLGLSCEEIDREFGMPHELNNSYVLRYSYDLVDTQWLATNYTFELLRPKERKALVKWYRDRGCKWRDSEIVRHLKCLYPFRLTRGNQVGRTHSSTQSPERDEQ